MEEDETGHEEEAEGRQEDKPFLEEKTSASGLGLEATKKPQTLKKPCAFGKASTTRKWRTDGEKSSLFKKFFEKCGRSSKTGDVDGKHSLKMNSVRSSDAPHRGRLVASTQCIPSPSRNARPSERQSSSW